MLVCCLSLSLTSLLRNVLPDLETPWYLWLEWFTIQAIASLWNSFRFLNILSCVSKRPASCNPNESGDPKLLKFGMQNRWMLSNAKEEYYFSWILVCCLSLSHIIVKRCLTSCLNTLVFMIVANMFCFWSLCVVFHFQCCHLFVN